MSALRLSALDASFLSVESDSAHMHVGWVAHFGVGEERPMPGFHALRDHIGRRIGRAPRYRQKLAAVPLGLNSDEWIDDAGFSIERHVYWASGSLDDLVDEVMSIPLRRDRPLWEIWIHENEEDRRFALVGKVHHCMVDGLAALELASLILDPTPEPLEPEPSDWQADPEPTGEWLLARGLADLLGEQLDLVRYAKRAALAPGSAAKETATGAVRVARALDKLLRPAPTSGLNRPLSPLRCLATAQRPLEDLCAIKRAYGTTVNDVVLAAVAGGLRAHLLRNGEESVPLKVMVPVNVRKPGEIMGNHISFVFTELPCHEPDPVGRLYKVHTAMSQAKRDGEPEGSDLVLKAAGRTPPTVQRALSRLFAGPRACNLVVSNMPGPKEPMYMLGCPLEAVYPMVPLADQNPVSVGVLTVHDQACIGIYADREAMPDARQLAEDLDAALGELLVSSYRVMESGGSLLARALAVPSEPFERSPSRPIRETTPVDHEYERELQRLANGEAPRARRTTAAPTAPTESADAPFARRFPPASPDLTR